MNNSIGDINYLRKIAQEQADIPEDLPHLLAVLENFINDQDISVVYPRVSMADLEAEGWDGICLELVVFTVDGRIIIASVSPLVRFEVIIINQSEICSYSVKGHLVPYIEEAMPSLTINFKDGSQLDLNSGEDANEYWGEEYPGLIKLIIQQLK